MVTGRGDDRESTSLDQVGQFVPVRSMLWPRLVIDKSRMTLPDCWKAGGLQGEASVKLGYSKEAPRGRLRPFPDRGKGIEKTQRRKGLGRARSRARLSSGQV